MYIKMYEIRESDYKGSMLLTPRVRLVIIDQPHTTQIKNSQLSGNDHFVFDSSTNTSGRGKIVILKEKDQEYNLGVQLPVV